MRWSVRFQASMQQSNGAWCDVQITFFVRAIDLERAIAEGKGLAEKFDLVDSTWSLVEAKRHD